MKEEKDILNTLIKKAKAVKLSEKERTALFARVDSYVKQNPIKAKNTANDIKWFSYVFSNYSRAVSFALVVFIILGGSTSIAAEGTLPGDSLYTIKININEGIKSLFVSNANKADYEASRAVLRLQEAETLAKNGALSPEAKIQLEANFNAHVVEVEKNIQKYKDNGDLKKAFDASLNLESSLKSQEESLSNLRDIQIDGNNEQLSNIVDKVQETIASSSFAREEVEQSIVDSDGDNDDVRAIAESKLDAIKVLVKNLNIEDTNLSQEVSSDVSAAKVNSTATISTKMAAPTITKVSTTLLDDSVDQDISDRLKETNSLTAEGQDKLKKGSYKEAHVFFKKAYNAAQEANILKDLKNTADIKTDDL